jgi:hypothetical protein
MATRRWILAGLALLLLSWAAPRTAGAQELVAQDSWWHVDFSERRVRLELGLAGEVTLTSFGPQTTEFLGPLGVIEARAGYQVLSWLAVDGGLALRFGQDQGLFGGGESNKSGLALSAGAQVALPLRITPYLGARLGWSYEDNRWSLADGGGLDGYGTRGIDHVNAMFLRGEGGVAFHLSDAVALRVGVHADLDLAHAIRREVRTGSPGDVVAEEPHGILRHAGVEVAAVARF